MNDILLYLAPSAALALLIRVLAGAHPIFFLFTVAGTICHELAHYVVGLLTGARPASFTVIPRRVGRHWELGSVTLTRVRWYNAAPTALAPLLIVLLPFCVAWWRTRQPWQFEAFDLLVALALAPQFLRFWPSVVDWRIALRSWPYLFIIGGALWLLFYFRPHLFQFVNP
ncbi:hypothetical protein HF313_15225 [Massilia atriviolacea]|uniref:M50 family peptidase n=1 Tax=Massilia atriviolacea TaxID=2495579 RepID=A0A430HRC5_9BURK|nr:hypothetical protein [Massilia atriviolacea]RSZ60064.1 hypothetical protein EJB06_07745 [Massilia atriviolacea]